MVGDSTAESDEGFLVTLSNASGGATITTATATGSIVNDDLGPSGPTLSIAATDAVKMEGNSGRGVTFTPFTFTVTRAGDTSGATTVSYAVTGTGVNPANAADFGGTLPSGTVSFAAGETAKTVTINVAGDSTAESDEGFLVTLSNASGGATITTATATGTIQSDDAAALSIAAASATKAEGNSGTTPFTFTVTRAGDTSGTTTVTYAVTGTGANPANAADFGGTLPSGTVSFAAGETTKTVTINVVGDSTAESDEGFLVTLSNASGGATITTATATGTIQNDEAATLSIAAASATKAEGNSGTTPFTFTVTRAGDTSGATTVTYAVTGTGANPANAADFGGTLPSGTVSFAAGETTKTVTINVGRRQHGGTRRGLPGDAVECLRRRHHHHRDRHRHDPERRRDHARDRGASATKAEGNSGTTPFTFTVTRAGDTSGATTVTYAVTGTGANPANAADFGGTLPSGTVSFAAGESTKTVTIDVVGDSTAESDEGFLVTLSNASGGATITTATATGTIQNDDVTTLAIAAASATKAEGNSGTTPFTFTVTRAGDTSGATTVTYAVDRAPASTRPTRRTSAGRCRPARCRSPPAKPPRSSPSRSPATARSRSDEGFLVTLSNAAGGATITTATATGTIQNDDLPTLRSRRIGLATDAVKAEGNSAAASRSRRSPSR